MSVDDGVFTSDLRSAEYFHRKRECPRLPTDSAAVFNEPRELAAQDLAACPLCVSGEGGA